MSPSILVGVIGNSDWLESDRSRLKRESDEKFDLGDGGVAVGVGVVASLLTLLMVLDVSEGDRPLPRAKSRSILGVRSNCLCRLLSERGGVVLVVMVRSLGFKLNVRDSSETSVIEGSRLFRRRVLNRGYFGGISDDGEGSGC
jgi:hypothetical protein